MGALNYIEYENYPHSTTDGPTLVKTILGNPNGLRASISLMREGPDLNHNGRWTRKLNGEP